MLIKPAQISSIRHPPLTAPRCVSVRARLTALAALCLAALAVAPISSASAAFVWGDAHQVDLGQTITDMSCPTATQCTVVGDSNDETTFDPQTGGTVNAFPIASTGAYQGISCWSVTQCTAVGGGNEVTFDPNVQNPTTPAPHAAIDANPGVDLVSVSCLGANQCSAVDGNSGKEVTFNPTTGAAEDPTTVDTHGDLTNVTCLTTTECVAVDDAGWEATFDPTGVAATFTQEVGLANGVTNALPSLSSITCPTADQCSASANNGSAATFNPHSTTATNRQFLSPTSQYGGMACPTTSFCVTASAHNGVVSLDPHANSPTTVTPLGVLGQGPIVCFSASQCTVSSGVGATTFDPADPSITTDVSFAPAVAGISCPSSTACWLGDQGGNFLLATPGSLGPSLTAVTGGSILAISCPTSLRCTAAEANGQVRMFDLADGTGTSTFVSASAATAIDCPTITVCAVGESNGATKTFNSQTSTISSGSTVLDPSQAIESISCADDTHCVAVDAAGAETSYNPQSLNSPHTAVPVDPGIPLVAVSCPSDAQCTAVDGNGQEVTFDPLTGGVLSLVSIDAGNALSAISCPETTECVAVDSAGQSLAGNPQDAATPWDVEPIPGTSVLTGVSCPADNECSAIDSNGEYSVTVPVSSAPPTISGAAAVGQTLTETHAAWSGSATTFTYRWDDCDADGRNCAPIANASNPSYTVAAGDVGHTIRIVETASNAGGAGAPATSNPTGVVPAPSTTTPTTSSTTTTTPTTPPVSKRRPPAAEVKAALAQVLAPSSARIKTLLRAGGYTFAFDAPSAGKLVLNWYLVPKRARLADARAAKPRPKPVLVASVSAKTTTARKIKVKVKLSRTGRTRLRAAGTSLKLTGQASFTPSGAKQTTIRRTFTVRR
jgi:hypothetical protein